MGLAPGRGGGAAPARNMPGNLCPMLQRSLLVTGGEETRVSEKNGLKNQAQYLRKRCFGHFQPFAYSSCGGDLPKPTRLLNPFPVNAIFEPEAPRDMWSGFASMLCR